MGNSVIELWSPRATCFLPRHIEEKISGDKKANHTEELRRVRRENKVHRIAAIASTSTAVQFTVYTAGNKKTLPGNEMRLSKIKRDQSALDALNGAKKTIEFYQKVYHRNSIDGKGMDIDSTVHYGKQYANAFWNGKQMVYGDGDHDFLSFTKDLDVIGHEFTHGVTEHSPASLDYENQSGALNESMSDIFGAQVKQYAKMQTVQHADWLIGDFVIKDKPDGEKEALRTMTEKKAYNNSYLGVDDQPKKMGDFQNLPNDDDHDNGGVHTNSGIPNHWFYLLSMDLGGYSWDKAGPIVYQTLMSGQVRHNATFLDFATATVAIAAKNFGKNSAEYNAVMRAWKGVEIDPKE